MEHEKQAEELEREARRLEQHSEEIGDRIELAKDDRSQEEDTEGLDARPEQAEEDEEEQARE
jgi:hypothetical protein